MKRITALIFLLLLMLCNCRAFAEVPDILVVYFSCTGTTEPLAKYAAEYLHADLYEIVPAEPYTAADLAYYTRGRADQEQDDPSARPDIANPVPDLSSYQTILLGYPIWHGQAPRIISTFLESCDLAGKTVLPFCTSHSSSIGSSDTNLHRLCPDGVNWMKGKRFSAGTTADTIAAWLSAEGIEPCEKEDVQTMGGFDLTTGTVQLNNGMVMATSGIGTYSLHDETCVGSVYTALADGYRLIDTAHAYYNEAEVGTAVRKAIDDGIVTRDEIIVITKLYPDQYSHPEQAIEEALAALDIDYIDILLLHHPAWNDVQAYHAMEKYVEAGKIRALGLSCYYIDELDAFLPQISIMPVLVQNEIHPYYSDREVTRYIQSKSIAVQAWYPLGGRGHQTELLHDPVLVEIAEAHGKSVAQVILRWDLQNGVIVIPGSSNPDHILENISVYDFELTDEEMARIDALNRDEKHDWY